jgi:hypothetical protein
MNKLSTPAKDDIIFGVVVFVLIHVNCMFMPGGVYAKLTYILLNIVHGI